jgi:hypothetical protein
MSKVDFAAAVFRDVEFRGFGLEDVTLPPEPDVRLYRRARCVARRGIELLEGDGSKPAQMLRAVLQDCLHGPGADQDAPVFVRLTTLMAAARTWLPWRRMFWDALRLSASASCRPSG